MKLDPRTKVILIILGNILLFSYGQTIYLYIATAFALILMMLLGQSKKAIKLGIFFSLLYLFTYLMTFSPKEIHGLWSMLILPIIIFIPLYALAILFFTTTQINEIIVALQRMHLSSKLITPLIVMFRFFPTLKIELKAIYDAMKLKGMKKNPVKVIEYVYAPLLFNCVKISEDLHISGVTRGLGLNQSTTPMVNIKFRLFDLFVIIVMIILILLRREVIII